MRIKEIREAKGLQQKALAKNLGIKPNRLSQYETGAREPDLKTLDSIARELEVSVDDLMGREIAKEEPTPDDEDGLNAEQLEIIRLYDAATPVLRAAALAVLRSAEERDKALGDALSNE